MIYVMDAQYCVWSGADQPPNILFTSPNRSRGWVKVSFCDESVGPPKSLIPIDRSCLPAITASQGGTEERLPFSPMP